jgi:hypothetical protein
VEVTFVLVGKTALAVADHVHYLEKQFYSKEEKIYAIPLHGQWVVLQSSSL